VTRPGFLSFELHVCDIAAPDSREHKGLFAGNLKFAGARAENHIEKD